MTPTIVSEKGEGNQKEKRKRKQVKIGDIYCNPLETMKNEYQNLLMPPRPSGPSRNPGSGQGLASDF